MTCLPPWRLGRERREVPDEVARLLLGEDDARDVLRLRPSSSGLRRVVDDRELRVRELLRDRVQVASAMQEADADHEVVARRGRGRAGSGRSRRPLFETEDAAPGCRARSARLCRPLLASWLNDLSLRPPMSVTSATLSVAAAACSAEPAEPTVSAADRDERDRGADHRCLRLSRALLTMSILPS